MTFKVQLETIRSPAVMVTIRYVVAVAQTSFMARLEVT
jgi:hypothetical protein